MKILGRFLLVLALGAIGFWLWTVFFPNEEKLIRKHLTNTAHAASFSANESPLAQLGSLAELRDYFTADVELNFDVPGRGRQTLQGRDDLLALAKFARDRIGALKIEFLDVTVRLTDDRQSATAVLTLRAQVSGDPDFTVQEMKFALKKINRRWFINRVETVKTLSAAPRRENSVHL